MKQMAAIVTALVLATLSALAQHQPYAGWEGRPVKTLSSEQIADLRAGRGMGLALAAELNSYPGPVHLLELAERLGLTEAQAARIAALVRAMKAETIPLGERLIAQEAELDRQFAQRTVTPASLAEAVKAIAATQAELRTAHLRYHLLTVELLSPEQIGLYNELRGYSGGAPSGGHGHRRH